MKKNYLRDYLFHIPEFQPCIYPVTGSFSGRRDLPAAAALHYVPSGAPLTFLRDLARPIAMGGARKDRDHPVPQGTDRIRSWHEKKATLFIAPFHLFDTLPVDDARIASIARIAASLEHIPESTDDIIASVRAFFGNPAVRPVF